MLMCFVKLLKFEICLNFKIFKTIPKHLKKIIRKFNEWILSKIVKVLNILSILYIVNKVNDCVLRRICESLNKFSKFYWKTVFKKIFNKNLGKFDETLNSLLLSTLIACLGVSCSLSFANFPGFREMGKLPPGDTTGIN